MIAREEADSINLLYHDESTMNQLAEADYSHLQDTQYLLMILDSLQHDEVDHAHRLARKANFFEETKRCVEVHEETMSMVSKKDVLSLLTNYALCQLASNYQSASKSGWISKLKHYISKCTSNAEVKIYYSLYLNLLASPLDNSLLVVLLNSLVHTKIINRTKLKSKTSNYTLTPKKVAEDFFTEFKEVKSFRAIANQMTTPNLWKTYRALLFGGDSPLKQEQLQFCLEAILQSPNFKFSLNYIELTLNTDKAKLAYSLFMRYKQSIIHLLEASEDDRDQFWIALSQSMENGLLLELKFRMAKQLLRLSTRQFAESLCSLEVAMCISQNPIKTTLLFHQVLGLLKPYFSVLHAPLSEKQEAMVHLCGLFLQEIENEYHLTQLLHDKDIDGREVNDLIKYHPNLLLKIQSLIQREWQGPLDLFACKTLSLSTLFNINSQTPWSVILLRRGYWQRFKEVETPFQFHFFRRSPLAKYAEHFLLIALIACLLSVVGVKIVESKRTVYINEQNLPTETAQEAAYIGVTYMRIMMLLVWPLGAFYSLQDLLDIAYERKGKEKVQVQICEKIVDMTILISVVLLFFTYDLSLLKFNENNLMDYHNTMLIVRPSQAAQTYFGIFGSCLWIKVLYHLRLNSLFGPLLTIFSHMSKVIIQFCLLLILLIVTFAFSGRILFSVNEFSSFYESLITLFSWMLGEFVFDTMSQEGWIGEVFLALYLLICMVLMVNLLIALLSTTYSTLASQGVGLYLQNIIEEQPRWAYHPHYNFFSYRAPLFNAVSICSLPCLSKCSMKQRIAVEKIQYIPAYLMSLIIILLADLLSLPFAWLQVIRRGCSRTEPSSMLFSIFVFPFVAIIISFIDVGVSTVKLWDSESYKEFEKRNKEVRVNQRISQEDLKTLKDVLERKYKTSNKVIPLSTVVKQMRDEMPFACTYLDIAQVALSERDPKTLKILEEKEFMLPSEKGQRSSFMKSFHPSQSRVFNFFIEPAQKKSVSTSRFNSVKQLLSTNSYRDSSGKFFIFPGLLLQALNEIQRMEQVRTNPITNPKLHKSRTIDLEEDLESLEYNRLEWMLLGKYAKKENQFRLEGPDMTQTAIDYIKDQSNETGIKFERRINPYRKKKRAQRQRIKLSTVQAKYSEDSLLLV